MPKDPTVPSKPPPPLVGHLSLHCRALPGCCKGFVVSADEGSLLQGVPAGKCIAIRPDVTVSACVGSPRVHLPIGKASRD